MNATGVLGATRAGRSYLGSRFLCTTNSLFPFCKQTASNKAGKKLKHCSEKHYSEWTAAPAGSPASSLAPDGASPARPEFTRRFGQPLIPPAPAVSAASRRCAWAVCQTFSPQYFGRRLPHCPPVMARSGRPAHAAAGGAGPHASTYQPRPFVCSMGLDGTTVAASRSSLGRQSIRLLLTPPQSSPQPAGTKLQRWRGRGCRTK